MVLDLCGGEASEISVAGPARGRSADRFPAVRGRAPDRRGARSQRHAGPLEELGFALAAMPGNAGHVQVRAPSWRPDIEGKADLVEEVIRLAGLDRVTPTPLERDGRGCRSGPHPVAAAGCAAPEGRWPRAVWSRR